jgi:hypothetical protein
MAAHSETNVLPVVKAGFILRGTTFKRWCRETGIHPGYAHDVAAGKTNGPKARALRSRIVAASRGALT